MFKIPLVRPEQHSLAWDVLHWDPVPPVGIAVTAPTVARNTMAEMKCILRSRIVILRGQGMKVCAVVDIDLEAWMDQLNEMGGCSSLK